jgi:ankyrin repeat protein
VVVKLLVKRENVVADSEDEFGQTPLLWAAEEGHKAVVKLLRSIYSLIANHT